MDTVPSWKIPHRFVRRAAGRRDEEVVTFGLFAPLLAAADLTSTTGLGDLASRVGIDELCVLGERGVPQPDLPWAEFMERAESGGEPLPGPATTTNELLEQGAAQRVADFVGEFRHLVDEIEHAADERRAPRPHPNGVDGTSQELLALLETHYGRGRDGRGRGLELQPLFRRDRPNRLLWGFRFRDLAERVSVELFEVYTRRPRIRRCRLCKRAYVAVGSEQFCHLRLWSLPGYELLEYCVPMEQVEEHNAAELAVEHRRQRKNLWQKWRRDTARYGPNSKPAKTARKAFETYKREHHRPRGPKPDAEIPKERLTITKQKGDSHG